MGKTTQGIKRSTLIRIAPIAAAICLWSPFSQATCSEDRESAKMIMEMRQSELSKQEVQDRVGTAYFASMPSASDMDGHQKYLQIRRGALWWLMITEAYLLPTKESEDEKRSLIEDFADEYEQQCIDSQGFED
ncbi:hypothetical protein [Halomonas binhaiensis]|uniref:Uncharacterized protein n=1 Tax=Halomonas binhaiensis TaxID=2562282 RepID=A0A5C1NGD2_9GAMM|nr:hypothetical protein [Halomonas binhaiensis]QEM81921.1 hypothetical protein E4T21_10410 [Halomonas binhaiensis]